MASMYKPCHQDAGNLRSKGLGHFSAAHISDAVQGQVHEGGVAAAQVVLDAVVDEADQVAVGVHQHGDEQVTLEARKLSQSTVPRNRRRVYAARLHNTFA